MSAGWCFSFASVSSYLNEAGQRPLAERARPLGALALYASLVWEAIAQLA